MKAKAGFVVLALLASLLLAAVAGAGGEEAKAPAAIEARVVKQGVAVQMTVAPVHGSAVREGEDATFRFDIADATGNPLSRTYPAAWLEKIGAGGPAVDCTKQVEQLLGGGYLDRPALDLNVYLILSLNEDGTITVVDPRFGFGGTQLLDLIDLGGPGEDWALAPDGGRVYVSVPATGKIVAVDTVSFKILAQIPVGPRPGRLALSPDGAFLWVTLADGEGVAAVRTADSTVTRIATGAGRHELALADDGRLAFVSNGGSESTAGSLSVIDAEKLAKRADVPLAAPPSAVAWSPLARAAYVVSEKAGTVEVVEVVDAARRQVTARVELAPGLAGIRFAPGGRLAFLPNPEINKLSILDASTNRVIQRADIPGGPDQVTFSSELAYVRQRRSETVLMIPLQQVGTEGKAVPVVDFPAGDHPLGAGALPSPAASIVRAPGANAVLVANPLDKTIYYYREGMAAPMGGFANYGRQPRALLTLDRTLKERAPGRYETVARVGAPGQYRLAFLMDAPRTVHCFELDIAPNPELAAKREIPLAINPLFGDLTVPAGQPLRLRFRAADPKTGAPKAGLTDLGVLAYLSSGGWHEHFWAREVSPGLYEVELVPPAATFKVAVECPSQKLPYNHTPERLITGTPPAKPGRRR